MYGDEGALALMANQHVVAHQVVHCFAHRALADPEFLRQLDLAGDEVTRRPCAVADALGEKFPHLHIERAFA